MNGPLTVKSQMGLFLAGKVFLDYWKCIVLWQVFLVSGKWSWILGSVWHHPGSVSGLWEEFLDERNFSRIRESVLRYWEVFEILGNVLRFWEVFCDY